MKQAEIQPSGKECGFGGSRKQIPKHSHSGHSPILSVLGETCQNTHPTRLSTHPTMNATHPLWYLLRKPKQQHRSRENPTLATNVPLGSQPCSRIWTSSLSQASPNTFQHPAAFTDSGQAGEGSICLTGTSPRVIVPSTCHACFLVLSPYEVDRVNFWCSWIAAN